MVLAKCRTGKLVKVAPVVKCKDGAARRLNKEEQPEAETEAAIEAIEDRALEENLNLEQLAEDLESLADGRQHGFFRSRVPPCPTRALPGTPDKIRVMTWRIEHGYSAFHPKDRREAPDTPRTPPIPLPMKREEEDP